MNPLHSIYHKIVEKICWKLGYVCLPEGDTFKNGVGEAITRKQKDYFLKLIDKYMERNDNILLDGLPFAMWRREDQIKVLTLIAFNIIIIILYVYLTINYYGHLGYGNADNIIAENVRVNVQLK